LDVAAINYKSRRIGPAPIAIHFLHQVAGRVDHRRIDTGWENLNGPQPATSGSSPHVVAFRRPAIREPRGTGSLSTKTSSSFAKGHR
jgi:hypothetical protein